MDKQAFVIMPYKQQLNRLYSMIIQDSLERKGYTCIRQDMVNSGGYIMSRVIKNLSESDIVIAVLTDFNWNVAYELGIRHVMRRHGTILMCDQSQKQDLKFDINGFDILFYDPEWMEKYSEESIIAELVNRIGAIENNDSTESDSPVHDVYSSLPMSVLDISHIDVNKDQMERIEKLKAENEALHEANKKLNERLKHLGVTDEGKSNNTDIRESMRRAVKNSIYYSDEAVEKLRELQEANKKEEFADFLSNVIEYGFLDEIDCSNVYKLCRRLSIPPITKLFMEQATKWYPENEELNIYFANELARYNNTRDQAYIIANQMLGITKKNGHIELTKHVSEKIIRAFYDVYNKLNRYSEIISLAPILLEEYSKSSIKAVIYRNVACAYMKQDQTDKAIEYCNKSIELVPQDDLTHHMFYRIYRQAEDYVNAYLEAELSISCDVNDEDYYFIIAGFICDELYARISTESNPVAIDSSDARDYAVPFVLFALAMKPECARRTLDFLKRNNFREDFERCLMAINSKSDIIESFDDLDFSFVQYCFSLRNN